MLKCSSRRFFGAGQPITYEAFGASEIFRIGLRLFLLFIVSGFVILGATRLGTAKAASQEMAGLSAEKVREFFETFRLNLTTGNHKAVCAVVQYPLKQLRGDVASVDDCLKRFNLIFTGDVVEAVRDSAFEDLFSNSGGIMIGLGQVWLSGVCLNERCSASDIKIYRVSNAGDAEERRNLSRDHIFLTCTADRRRLQVSADGNGGFQFHSWNELSSLSTSADVELRSGSKSVEGTGPCSHSSWVFQSETVRITLEELGCFPDSNPPPDRAVALFTIATENLPAETEWCFQIK